MKNTPRKIDENRTSYFVITYIKIFKKLSAIQHNLRFFSFSKVRNREKNIKSGAVDNLSRNKEIV
jgi:hypothetical protein